MKTVKFKDLPEKVQVFVNREIAPSGFEFHSNHDFCIDFLHSTLKWSKATDEERLAYAEWKYPKGTIFKPVIPNYKNDATGVIDSFHILYNGLASNLNWVYTENKWASIISEPEKEEQPEFKAGDEVEYQGSTISKVVHVFDGMAWIKNTDQKYGSLVDLCNLRKSDPDKEYREIAKEMIKSNNLMVTSQDNFIHGLTADNLYQMLIEAIKKGKEL